MKTQNKYLKDQFLSLGKAVSELLFHIFLWLQDEIDISFVEFHYVSRLAPRPTTGFRHNYLKFKSNELPL